MSEKKRGTIRLCIPAVILLGLITQISAAGMVSADEHRAPAKERVCPYQPYDNVGRCPLLTYKVVVSRSDPICNKITSALNHAPAGPDKLWSNPIFVQWRTDGDYDPANSHNIDIPGPVWVVAPIFNDGRPVAVERLRSEAGPSLVLFTEANAFKHFLASGENPPRAWYPNPVVDATTGALGANPPIGWPILSPIEQTAKRWSAAPAVRSSSNELHWANIDGTILLVARVYIQEIVYVVKFQPGKFSDICYLASDHWWEPFSNRVVEHYGMN